MGVESDDEEEQGEDAFMTIGKHLRKEGGWYRLLRALKKRQIEREKVCGGRERGLLRVCEFCFFFSV